MISIEELNQIKEQRKTNQYYEEKEYLQYIFLNAISRYPENFVFKGGTCLRICYGLERASEDLDFNTNLSENKLKEVVNQCLKDFDYLNIGYEIYSEKEFEGNLRIEIRFKGVLFSGSLKTTNTLKIDFNKQKISHKTVTVVQKLFSDVPLFTIVALDEKEILAEKIRAILSRKQSRDMYDLWILIGKKVEIDNDLIQKKLHEEHVKITSEFDLPSKKKYEQDLKELIRFVPPYEQVRTNILLILNEIKTMLKNE